MDAMAPLFTIPVAEVLGWNKKDDNVLVGFRQPNGAQVALEISEENLWSIMCEIIGARRAFGVSEVGISDERALPVSRIDYGSTLGHPDRVFLRLVTPEGAGLGIEAPAHVAKDLAAQILR